MFELTRNDSRKTYKGQAEAQLATESAAVIEPLVSRLVADACAFKVLTSGIETMLHEQNCDGCMDGTVPRHVYNRLQIHDDLRL